MKDNRDIENSLSSALNAAAPDILNDLLDELGLDKDTEPTLRERMADDTQVTYRTPVKRRANLRALISCAAALIILVGAAAVWNNINRTVFAVVDFDVNPSIELTINQKEKIIGAKAVNPEGEAILADMKLEGLDIQTASNAIIGSMLMNGYLTDRSNSILVSVAAGDETKGQEIEERLSRHINDFMDDKVLAAAILGQNVRSDEELERFAGDNGISLGKAWLIRRLLDTGNSKMTEDSLLSLSTQELIVLSQERNVQSDTAYGKADTGKYISRDSALEAALKHTGLDASQVSGTETEMDCENGKIIYEVEFRYAGSKYEVDIDAVTGTVVHSERENVSSTGDDDDDDLYDDSDDDDNDDDDD